MMSKKTVLIGIIFLISLPSYAQWTEDGSTIYYDGNKVGIGITSPVYPLDVDGRIQSSGNMRVGGADLVLGFDDNRNQGNIPYNRALVHRELGIGNDNLTINYSGDFESGVHIQGPKTVIDGRLGIGINSPDKKLTINGIAKAEEVIVTESVGADFVFEDDYILPDLKELEAHIKDHKHLPEIPSAEEMKHNGVKVGDLQMKLLQKIEELTLYIIEQQKTIKNEQHTKDLLRKELNNQKQIIKSLAKRVKELEENIK